MGDGGTLPGDLTGDALRCRNSWKRPAKPRRGAEAGGVAAGGVAAASAAAASTDAESTGAAAAGFGGDLRTGRGRVRRAFGRAAEDYTRHARLQAEVAGRLLERLDGLKFEPKTVVDLGCGPGVQAKALSQRFRDARVVAMDWSLPMLHCAGAAARGS